MAKHRLYIVADDDANAPWEAMDTGAYIMRLGSLYEGGGTIMQEQSGDPARLLETLATAPKDSRVRRACRRFIREQEGGMESPFQTVLNYAGNITEPKAAEFLASIGVGGYAAVDGYKVWMGPDNTVGTPRQSLQKIADGIARDIRSWQNGDCYGYVFGEVTTCDHGHEHFTEKDSCWGFIGPDLKTNGIMEYIPPEGKALMENGREYETTRGRCWARCFESL